MDYSKKEHSHKKLNSIFLIANDFLTISNFRRDLIRELKRKEYSVTIICPEDSDYLSKEAIKSFIAEYNLNLIPLNLSRTGLNPIEAITYLINLIKILREHKPDHVLLYTSKTVIFGSLASHFAKVPNIISTITGLGYVFIGKTLKARLLISCLKILYRISLKLNNLVFFQNQDDLDFFINKKLIISDKSRLIAGSGVNLKYFYPKKKQGSIFTFIMIARILPEKGVHEYIEAAKLLKKEFPLCKIQLLGPLDNSQNIITSFDIESWVSDGLIEYHSFKDDVRDFLAEADVFVLPSYREGTPKSALEAMAMGKPIIVSDVPGCREVILDKRNGILVPPKDHLALFKAMKEFIINKDLVSSAGAESLQIAREKFDVKKVNSFFLDQIKLI